MAFLLQTSGPFFGNIYAMLHDNKFFPTGTVKFLNVPVRGTGSIEIDLLLTTRSFSGSPFGSPADV